MSNTYFSYLRGNKVLIADYHANPENIPYTLENYEKGKTPNELYLSAIYNLASNFLGSIIYIMLNKHCKNPPFVMLKIMKGFSMNFLQKMRLNII